MKLINPFDQTDAMTFGRTLDAVIDDAPGLRNGSDCTAAARRAAPQS